MCRPDSPWLYSCPCVDSVCQGFVLLYLRRSLSFFPSLPFVCPLCPSFSSLAARTPCVLSRCTVDLTASLSSQQASELRDRCAKFKVGIPEKSSLMSGPRLRRFVQPLSCFSRQRSSTLGSSPQMNRESMTDAVPQIESVNKGAAVEFVDLSPRHKLLFSRVK